MEYEFEGRMKKLWGLNFFEIIYPTLWKIKLLIVENIKDIWVFYFNFLLIRIAQCTPLSPLSRYPLRYLKFIFLILFDKSRNSTLEGDPSVAPCNTRPAETRDFIGIAQVFPPEEK